MTGVLLGGVLVLNAAAHANPCEPVKPAKKSDDVVTGALGGAALGGVLGGVFGNNSKGGDAKKGIAVGTIVGGVIGGAAGAVAANRRADFESESTYLDCEIYKTEVAINERTQAIETATRELATTRTEVAHINTRYAANKASARDVGRIRDNVRARVEAYDAQMVALNGEIDRLEQVERDAAKASGENPQLLQQRVTLLSERRRSLRDQYYALNDIRDQTQTAMASLPAVG